MVRSPRLPADLRVYAIGDIHGRADLLDELYGMIERDGAGAAQTRRVIVHLGDYVDRGPHSRRVLDRLVGGPPDGFDAVYLKGNHEDLMLRFLADRQYASIWFSNGGIETLASYGVAIDSGGRPRPLEELHAAFVAGLPREHVDFLGRLKAFHAEGSYFFVHAGVRPGVPLDRQDVEDLMWIRDVFLASQADHGKIVVHGHSISFAPEMLANRIGIDTGAYVTGRLTGLVLWGDAHALLQTAT